MTTESLPQKQIFECSNLTLAIALASLGVPFANADGRSLFGLNKYTLAFIRGHALHEKTKGMTHDDAIRFMWRNGQPGNISYCFERSPLLTEICEGWDDQAAAGDTPSDLEVSPKDAGRIARRLSQTRSQFIGDKFTVPLWRRKDPEGNLLVPAIAHTLGTSATESTGDNATRTVIRNAQMRGVQI
jgi:hypothetical protein